MNASHGVPHNVRKGSATVRALLLTLPQYAESHGHDGPWSETEWGLWWLGAAGEASRRRDSMRMRRLTAPDAGRWLSMNCPLTPATDMCAR